MKAVQTDRRTVIIKHDAIPGYMKTMTMPFNVREPKELEGLQAGDTIAFRLQVTEGESWIDQVSKTRPSAAKMAAPASTADAASGTTLSQTADPALQQSSSGQSRHPLMDYPFTNELGEAVALSQFRGKALAITFFFTRCPIPEYCPRLSKNFAEASRKLKDMPDAPTNWHFLSVSIDTEFDTPAVLKGYGDQYGYDPAHWSFLTGPADQITSLARESGLTFDREGTFFSHDFRTLIVDPSGQLRMTIPIGGDLSDVIVEAIIKVVSGGRQDGARP